MSWGRQKYALCWLFSTLAIVASCALNPQPEPPGDKAGERSGTGGSIGSAGSSTSGNTGGSMNAAGGGALGLAGAGPADAGPLPPSDAPGVADAAADASLIQDAGTEGDGTVPDAETDGTDAADAAGDATDGGSDSAEVGPGDAPAE
jgi:hypothetical protein